MLQFSYVNYEKYFQLKSTAQCNTDVKLRTNSVILLLTVTILHTNGYKNENRDDRVYILIILKAASE